MDAYEYLPGAIGDAWERMCGETGDGWNRLAGTRWYMTRREEEELLLL